MYTVVINFGNKLWEGKTLENADVIARKGFVTVKLAASIDTNTGEYNYEKAKEAHVFLHNIILIQHV